MRATVEFGENLKTKPVLPLPYIQEPRDLCIFVLF